MQIHTGSSVFVISVCAVQGYGTVRFETVEAANTAIEKFHGSECEGRTLTVKLDQYA